MLHTKRIGISHLNHELVCVERKIKVFSIGNLDLTLNANTLILPSAF